MSSALKPSPKVAIIGGGVAGIEAARCLFHNGIQHITIFEAAARIGGRINSVKFGDAYIEMGAQWIHGQEDNVLFDYAQAHNLVADPFSDFGIEGTGTFCTDDGKYSNCRLVEELITSLDEAKNIDVDATIPSMYDYFRSEFDSFVKSKPNLSANNLNLLKSVFRWFIIFEVIDNSCDDLRDLSSLSYTEWEECDGLVDLINLKNGYSSVIIEMCKEVPINAMLRLKTAVNKIQPVLCKENNQVKMKVKLHTTKLHSNVEDLNGMPLSGQKEEYLFDHVIITSSLGYLKAQLKTDFFGFPLPIEKVNIIRSLGFGTVNKIFLYFDRPFWFKEEKGFQVLWRNVHDMHSYSGIEDSTVDEKPEEDKLPNWVYCIQAFDVVRGQPNMLMAWIGSYGAKEMENNSNEEIGRICGRVLRQIVPTSRQTSVISDPTDVFASRWYSHPFVRGSYSNRTINYENLQLDAEYNVDVLSIPILSKDCQVPLGENHLSNEESPLVLFAGEATDRSHYSSTHGAFRSGTREAARLLDYYYDQP